jgi:hypothetical protein
MRSLSVFAAALLAAWGLGGPWAAPGPSAPPVLLAQAGGDKKGEPPGEDDRVPRFRIYQDAAGKENHGSWSNWMPKGADKTITLNLADRANPAEGETCVRMTFKFTPPNNWCGVAVSCTDDYWGETPSDTAYDLRRAGKLVFWARGDKGRESIQVKVAIAGAQPYGDSARIPAATPWLELEKTWKRYELPLDRRRINLTRVVIPVCVIGTRDHNQTDEITFWLDNIYFVLDGRQ